jgi:hypothetical protein
MKIQLRIRPRESPESIQVAPTLVTVHTRPMRVLDFDIENRPLSYLGSDFTTGEVTAISWAWVDTPQDVTVYLLGETELPDILAAFVLAYQSADMVTGHYIRGHDLPMINGALMEFGMSALTEKLTQDTKIDLMRAKGLSKSQESLAAMLGLAAQKVQMNQIKWRAANRLTPAGLAEVRKRVVGDVQQHIELRAQLIELGYLGPPRLWKPGVTMSPVESYTP